MSDLPRRRILHLFTVPVSLRLIRGQAEYLAGRGCEVHCIVSPGPQLADVAAAEGLTVHPIALTRSMSPCRDLVALVRIWWTIRKVRPHIVHGNTPKAGLLGMLAASLARVPVRVYQLRGLRFVTTRGLKRAVLRTCELITCRLAHTVLCNSHSVLDEVVAGGLSSRRRIKVLARGSGNGVDAADRFDPARYDAAARGKIRRRWDFTEKDFVIGYVGRLVRDKGIEDLAEAWGRLRGACPSARLILVGDFEAGDPVAAETRERFRADRRVRLCGWADDPRDFYAGMDLLVLPSHREGFPNTPLEAAAMALAVVTTQVPGCVDSVADGVSGTIVPAHSPERLCRAMRAYLEDPDLRRQHGEAGRRRALEHFRPETIWQALSAEYERLLEERSSPPADARCGARCRGASRAVKRCADIVGALLGLIVLSPVMVLSALLVRMSLGAPVLFIQKRPGYRERPFSMFKFRTMRTSPSSVHGQLPDAQRLTRLGRALRKWSVDELPELWNVLKGEMSLVGPRPLLMEYLDLYSPEERRRHEVKPGITGWAQVNGRNAVPWKKRFELDVWYVDHWSLGLDCKIVLMTLVNVIRGRGVSADGHATMPKFEGDGASGRGQREAEAMS